MAFSKHNIIPYEDFSISIRCKDQTKTNQPGFWILHGSGGISTNDDIWVEEALDKDYVVIQIDGYSGRGIYKQYWTSADEKRVHPYIRAIDLKKAYYHLVNNYHLVPFWNMSDNIALGFSDGGTAAVWLQTKDFDNIWKDSYALYPGLLGQYYPPELNEVDGNKIHLFVGELDNWTKKECCLLYQQNTNCHLTIWKDAHHSYSKPGVDNVWPDVFAYAMGPGWEGVRAKYSEEATKGTMNYVFTS